MGNWALICHATKQSTTDLRAWVVGHVRQSSISLVVSLFGVPTFLLIQGETADNLREQLAQVAAYSLVGPLALILAAYLYFFVRAPFRLYATHVAELKNLELMPG